MSRKTFLTICSVIACSVGAFALVAPGVLLASKGVAPSAAAHVWARELGVALIAFGVMFVFIRNVPDSPAVRALLAGAAVLQLGLFPIEIVAYYGGTITKASGVVPNSFLHLVLAGAFAYYATRVKTSQPASGPR